MSNTEPRSKAIKIDRDKMVIRFAGDSGDGVQLVGSQFSFTAALFGNNLSTFPDFPAEIRAPAGTVAGVSGYQVQIGKMHVHTPGDYTDVLVAFNPAALKSNLSYVKKGGTVIIDVDSFSPQNITRAGFESNPLKEDIWSGYHLIEAPISSLTKKALEGMQMNNKSIMQCKNMFALGITYWLFDRSFHNTEKYLEEKFKQAIALANKKALRAGYFFAETIEISPSIYRVAPASIEQGHYRHISGSIATAWGLMAATESIQKKLFFGSYPITPASDILHELVKNRDMGVITLQAEDEIAAVCSAIGASYAGQVGVTASSGPGMALKGEAMGLAIMAELPLVVIDVQRGGPSTGLPTKTEQSDMNLALYGRHGESPAIVLAASTPSHCFELAYRAVKLTVEHMTPVILLTDGYLAHGVEPWKLPKTEDLPPISIPAAVSNGKKYMPYMRNKETLSRYWAMPGMPGLEHRIGGLEKQRDTGNVSYEPENHEYMVEARAEKVKRVVRSIPELKARGKGKLLVVGWGSTYGSLHTSVGELYREGKDIDHVHFNYINPLPSNTEKIVRGYKKIVVCELNKGQFAAYLSSLFPGLHILSYNKIQGLPFAVSELKQFFLKHV